MRKQILTIIAVLASTLLFAQGYKDGDFEENTVRLKDIKLGKNWTIRKENNTGYMRYDYNNKNVFSISPTGVLYPSGIDATILPASIPDGDTTGQMLYWNGSEWNILSDGEDKRYMLYDGNASWLFSSGGYSVDSYQSYININPQANTPLSFDFYSKATDGSFWDITGMGGINLNSGDALKREALLAVSPNGIVTVRCKGTTTQNDPVDYHLDTTQFFTTTSTNRLIDIGTSTKPWGITYIQTFSQTTEPSTTQVPDGGMAWWIDTDDSNRLYLVRNQGGTVKKVELVD